MLTKTNELQRSTPEAQGIASSDLLDFVNALDQLDEIHSFMLLRHGHVVAEGWWSPYAPQHPHTLFSLSKSFTSTAVGFAVSEGLFSVDDPIISFFPDEVPDEISDNLKAMTVHHLLSMATGHDEDTMPHFFVRDDMNWVKAFFSVPVAHEPGTHFLYNTGATYILSALVQKKTGKKLTEYLTPRLFEPLGIEGATWELSPQGIETGGFGLNIKTEDIARFGQLYLQKGQWQGEQILSQAWVEKASSSQVSNGDDPNNDWNQGYGYQFWRCRHNNYRGDGAFGQFCIVMPEHDAVLAMTSGIADMGAPMNLVWDMLLPAMGKDALPDDRAAQDALKTKLDNLALPIVPGESTSPLSSQVSGKIYKFDSNDHNLESIALSFAESDCRVTIQYAAKEESITCAYGALHQGKTTLYNDLWKTEPVLYVASGAWTEDNCFKMRVQLYETPFFHSYAFKFEDEALSVEQRINVAFGSTDAHILKAYAE